MSEQAYIDAESLRHNALQQLMVRGAPAWTQLALVEGMLVMRHAVARWSASQGDVAGHAVTLGVDAGSLAKLDADPVTRELLVAALSGAAAQRPLETVTDVSLCWDGAVVTEAMGYRSAPRTRAPASLSDGLRAWLRALGEEGGERWEVVRDADTVTVRGPRPDATRGARVERALRALLGAKTVRWR